MALITPSADPNDLADSILRAAGLGSDEVSWTRARHHATEFTAARSASSLRSLFEQIL